MTNLEQSFADLCAKHGLLNAEIGMTAAPGCYPFFVSMQWADETREHGRNIASSSGESIAEALSRAVENMLVKRVPVPFSEALPETADV